MRGFQQVCILGTLGSDPDVRYTQGGMAVVTLSLATSKVVKDEEVTEWHRVKLFGRLGEVAAEYLTKGRPVFIVGELRTEKWTKDGVDRYSTDVIASEMQLLGGGAGAAQGSASRTGGGGGSRPARSEARTGGSGGRATAERQPAERATAGRTGPTEGAPFDDDIPF